MIDRQKVYEKYSGRCSYCGDPVEFKKMTVDHLYPQLLKDKTEIDIDCFENLMPSCKSCNSLKSAYPLE
ncbi:MAG: HNH endonuclease signature motif containing protein [Candidatus Woesearchaeota archaeon]